ncbi:cyclin-T1-4-like [Phragmites australis]|uniref:cyclin-T1-4-like n=1 Tax=Phragmites australis TaxID=29695 RepID=UPI002D7982CC|nr:cyclin-T1-4-like [Phragmites australis]
MSFQSFAAGPDIHNPHQHLQPHLYHNDPPPHPNPRRRRRRDHDDTYHPYPVPHVHSYPAAAAGTVPYHVPSDPLALSHLQERLFPLPPHSHPAADPPPPKRARRPPDPRWDRPPPAEAAPAAPERPPEEGDPGPLLSRDEIERRSPSRRDGIDSALEARLRASYCAYLRCLGIRLGLPQTTIATAVVYCHRFFFHRSHACHDRFLVATAALFLAAKSEETACLLNTVLRASCEVSQNQEFNLLPYMLRGQDWFQQYRESVIQAEQMILTTLDFELEVAHPYASLSSALSKLGLSHTVLFNVAWNLINEGLPSSLWLQFKPHHIAAGAAFLAAKFLHYDITFHPKFWHEFKTAPYIVQDVVQQLKELI